MANFPLQADSACATSVSRRALLAATPVIAGSALLAVPAEGRTSTDNGLAICISAYQDARADCDAWHSSVYDPAYEAFQAAKREVAHYTTKSSYVGVDRKSRHLSTESRVSQALVSSYRDEGRDFGNDDFGRCCAELAGAMDQRAQSLGKIDAAWDTRGLNQESDQRGDVPWNAFNAVRDYPVRTVEDLITKLTFIQSVDDDPYEIDALLVDLNRIAEGRA